MYRNEDLRKIMRLFLIVFLCSEMQPSETQMDSYENRMLYYRQDVNGTEATFNNTKYQASIRLQELDVIYGEGHMCSGALIAPSVVLTAASCVFNYHTNKPYHPAELKVVLGSMARYQLQEHTLIYSVTHSMQPSAFDAITLRDNLAILMLERDIPTMNENVKPINMYSQKIHNTKWYDNGGKNQFKVTTWLKTQEGLHLNPLMLFDASSVDEMECLQHYGPVYGVGMLCVTIMDSLEQDVGSPLFVDNKLLGLMSFSNDPKAPAVFTNIAYHSKWIKSKIGNGHNQNSSVWGTLGFLLLTFVAVKRSKYFKLLS